MMNKIESTLYDLNLHIENKRRQMLILQTELETLKFAADTVEVIMNNDRIPNQVIESNDE